MGIRNEIVKQILKLAGQVRREMDITPFDVMKECDATRSEIFDLELDGKSDNLVLVTWYIALLEECERETFRYLVYEMCHADNELIGGKDYEEDN